MMHRNYLRLAGLTLSLSLFLLAGCSLGKGTTEPTRLFQLHSLLSSETEKQYAAWEGGIAIALGINRFPEYLDRSRIVTRTSRNELRMADFEQWAASLKQNVLRVLAANLSVSLSTNRVAVFPWDKRRSYEYLVVVDVARFEGELGGDVSLIARWSIFGERDKNELLTKAASFSEPTGAEGYEALVAAMSKTLEDLSGEIAASIKSLS
jgi:uncharacterized lipoprotein YmbA